MIEQLYINENGGSLAAVKYLPEGTPMSCVIFVHAYSNWKDEHDYMFARMALALSRIGIATLTFDMRGHGESTLMLEEINVQTMMQDISAAFEYAQQNICSTVYAAAVGFSARLCAQALGNTPAGYALFAPIMEIPQSLKALSQYASIPVGEALEKLPDRAVAQKDMERMGMLPKFVTAEIVNGGIFTTGGYSGVSIDVPALVFSPQEGECEYGAFKRAQVKIMEGGGIMFRSPQVIEALAAEMCGFAK